MSALIFGSILSNGVITGEGFLFCTACALLIGLFLALLYYRTASVSKSYLMTLVMTPVIVELIIMLVNGNLGAGLAVAGAFSLVRFRSAPGSGQEITGIFLAMAAGLAAGMGYIGIAVLFTAVLALILTALMRSSFGEKSAAERILRISIPENLDYESVFDDVLEKYTETSDLTEVRTAEMGSLYRLTYRIRLKNGISLKQFMDDIRVRNGNLDVIVGRETALPGEL